MDDFVALVPVREGSQRVLKKNFRPFFKGKSLLDLKIDQLKSSKNISKIYVSSDSPQAKEIAHRAGVEFLKRDPWLCSSEVRWSDMIVGVAETIPGNPWVCWSHTTSPLFSDFDSAISEFQKSKDKFDSLVCVTKFQGFLLNPKGRPVNYSFGSWHDYSQDLDPLFSVTGALFIARKEDILKWRYLIGVRPRLYEQDPMTTVDVDTESDFQLASNMMMLQGKQD